MNTLPSWLLLIVAATLLWQFIGWTLDRWTGDVTVEVGDERGRSAGSIPDPCEVTTSPSTLTSSTVGRRAGRPIPRTAGTPFDWASDESFGDAA